WWIGDVIGALVVAPVLLAVMTLPALRWRHWRAVESAGLAIGTISVGAFVFGERWLPGGPPFHQPQLLLPLLVWAAVRFCQRGAAFATFLLAVIAVGATVLGSGPFVRPSLSESLLYLQVFMAVTAAVVLMLGALVAERQRAQREAR